MIRKLACLVLGTVLVLPLAFGCQSTPEERFVQQKDTQRMVAQISEAPEISATDAQIVRVEKTLEPAGEKLRVEIDAEVVGQDTVHPVARVRQGIFTQEEVTGFFNYLFDGKQAYGGRNEEREQTKDEIEDLIIYYRRCLEDGTAMDNTLFTEEELAEEITRLEAAYADAPEEAASTEYLSDGTLEDDRWIWGFDEQDSTPIRKLDVQSDDSAHLTVHTPTDAGEAKGTTPILLYDSSLEKPFDLSRVKRALPDGTSDPQIDIGLEEAAMVCEEFFAAGGMKDVALAGAVVVSDGDRDAYRLDFVRTVDGVPAASCHALDDGSGTDKPTAEEMELPWEYERIAVAVSENGIEAIDWSSKSSLPEVTTQDAAVLSLDEALNIFETMLKAKFAPVVEEDEPLEITVDRIQLAPLRIREMNAQGKSGLYVPAWVFYGRSNTDSLTVPGYPEIIMAINALDGSIINLQKGY